MDRGVERAKRTAEEAGFIFILFFFFLTIFLSFVIFFIPFFVSFLLSFLLIAFVPFSSNQCLFSVFSSGSIAAVQV